MKKRLISLTLIMGVLLSLTAVAVSAQGSGTQGNQKPFLGITFGPNDNGAVITSVLGDTPAANAGLETGDIITSVNGENVTAANLASVVGNLSIGATVKLDVLRNGNSMEIDATLGTQPQAPTMQINPSQVGRAYLGVALNQTDAGIVIESVVNGSPAADAGLQAGDVLTAVNGNAVDTSAAAANMIRSMNPGDTVTLSITRAGEPQEITVTLGSRMPQSGTMPALRGDMVMYDGQNWRIVALSQNSVLADAGLQAGDVVTAFNGDSLDPAGLNNLLNNQAANTTVTLTVERNGATQDIDVPVEALSAFMMFNFGEQGNMPFSFGFTPQGVTLGVQFTNLNADVAAQHNLSVTDGALITEVVPNSPADKAGLKVGDVVVSVDGDKVDAEHTLRDRLFAYEPGDQITLGVLRDGNTMNVDVTLGEGTGMGNMPFNFGFGDEGVPHFFFGPHGHFNLPQPPAQQPAAPGPNA